MTKNVKMGPKYAKKWGKIPKFDQNMRKNGEKWPKIPKFGQNMRKNGEKSPKMMKSTQVRTLSEHIKSRRPRGDF